MLRRRARTIELKTAAQVALMRDAGLAVSRALEAAAAAAAPGASTADLDAAARREILAGGASPSFQGYHGFPAAICACVNEEVVHGVPVERRRLREGDLVSIDCGAVLGGWHADAAVTVGVGAVPAAAAGLLSACEEALWHGLARARPGARLSDISHAVQRSATATGPYGIVEGYAGHGIGSAMHMDPPVANAGRAGRGPVLAEGMALAVEPLLTLGAGRTRLRGDGWTVVSDDGAWSAHFGHTVAITATGPWVLTAADGGAAGFARFPGALPRQAGSMASGRVREADSTI